jgi:hypothetical protein
MTTPARPARRSDGLTPSAQAESCRHRPARRLLLPGVAGWMCGRCCRVFWGQIVDAVPQRLPDWALALRRAARA